MGRIDRVKFLYVGDLVQPESDRLGPGIIIEIYQKPTFNTSFRWIRILHDDGKTSSWGNDQLALLSRAREEHPSRSEGSQ